MPDAFDNYIRDIQHLSDELKKLRAEIREKRQKNDADLIAQKTTAQEVVFGTNSTGKDILRLQEIKADLKKQWDGLFEEIDRLSEENNS